MATLEINGRRVEVDDSFRNLSPEQQQATVQEIAAQIGGGATTGAEAMRARGLRSPDPSAANAQTAGDIQSAKDEAVIAENPLGTRLASFNAGLPFVGSWVDEGIGMIDPAAGQRVRDWQGAMERARPGQDTALRLAGGVVGSVPLAVGAAAAAPAVAPAAMAGRVALGGATGAATGAAEGAVYGYGQAEGEGRAENAGRGAATGAAFGGVLGAVAPLAAKGIENMIRAYRGRDVNVIARELGVSKGAATVVKNALDADDMPSAMAALTRAGDDAMLADAGVGSRQLLDSATTVPGAAPRIAREAVDARATAAGTRFTGELDSTFGTAMGRDTTTTAIRTGTKAARGTAYDAAYGAAIDYSTPRGRAVERLWQRVPQKALARANELMSLDGASPQMLISIGQDGAVTTSAMPSVRQVDYVTKALNDLAETGEGAGALGGQTTLGAKYQNLSRGLRTMVRRSVPEYDKALNVAADAIRQKKAVDLGYDLLKPATTREVVREGLKGATRAERVAVKQGVRSWLDDTMANARQVMSDPERTEEAAEAVKGINALRTRASRNKLASVLGPQEADRFMGEVEEMATAFELRAAIAQNSKTAGRSAIREGVEQQAAPGVIRTLFEGKPLGATKRLVQVMFGNTPEAQQLRAQGVYAEIATALTQKRGADARRALVTVQRAIAGQPLTDQQAAMVARQLSSLGALAGHQTALQYTGTR